ncbi:MAG: polyphosphate kinase 1 [Natronospirillum sp.]|uniref:polyphosphate kinase 1 n=1 Tax=Natronospirillum sp. TaxID=2812955 RepID=UPI0025DECFD9|nr:polyphosphate kinase 1 [Natronospirillum sp.]MCH8553054.1 polyphosphate kinase 1 [Natronospirillum sp.]
MTDITAQHFSNRELSLMAFHWRVLAQAERSDIPLLERLRFLCISSSNMDEFFEIRVGGLKERLEAGIDAPGADGLGPAETLQEIAIRAHQLVNHQYSLLNDRLLPALLREGIRIVRREQWTEGQRRWLQAYFEDEVLPLLSPMGLDPAHPFPRILNKSLNFIVQLEGKDAFGRKSGMAVVPVPRSLPEMIRLPIRVGGRRYLTFVFMSSVIHEYLDGLFHGITSRAAYQFRVTRNSDLFVDEEEAEDLRRAIEGELVYRQYGDEVRLEVAENCPDDMVDFLLNQFEMTRTDLYRVDGPVNLNRLTQLIELASRPDLKFTPFTARLPKPVRKKDSIFTAIRKQDILFHHPFDSFRTIIDFLWAAARDSKVLAIKQTLYRTGPSSAIVDALVAAAKAGKEVTVVIELRARFDEEANVALSARLQEVGIHVVYGVVGYKTHAKMILVSRRENRNLRNYVHLGTGNYHPQTTRIYTDYGLLSANQELGEDVYRLFLQLTSLGKISKMTHLQHAPFTLHKGLLKRIDQEIKAARQGQPARIIGKMNGLYEERVTRKLYEASQAGVQIDLIVRGICQLKPGIPGVSENIRVRSVLGRFLEHTRVFYFSNAPHGGEIWASSADWMERNMFHRVESAFPILNRHMKDRVLRELEYYLRDNCEAWELQPNGAYLLCEPGKHKERFSAQDQLLGELSGKP